MVEHKPRCAGFRVHHVAFGEFHAQFVGVKQGEEVFLHAQVGQGAVAGGVAFAAIAGAKEVLLGQGTLFADAPHVAQADVEYFREGFGHFQGEGGHDVAALVVAFLFFLLGQLAQFGPC